MPTAFVVRERVPSFRFEFLGGLDRPNGLTSATPEFPSGVHHYVLLNIQRAAPSIRCFGGTVNLSLMRSMSAMRSPPGPDHASTALVMPPGNGSVGTGHAEIGSKDLEASA